MAVCVNPTCKKEFTPRRVYANTKRTDLRPQIYCSRSCAYEDKKRYIWHATERFRIAADERRAEGRTVYRDDEECGIDPPLPIEIAYANYVKRCKPNPPTYDFDDWYDIHLTYGGIDW